MKRITLLILSPFFLMGCYQTSLAPMFGPAAGASQGRIAHSAISSGISYGVKNQTGKYPIEHILKREKNKIAKKNWSNWERGSRKINLCKKYTSWQKRRY